MSGEEYTKMNELQIKCEELEKKLEESKKLENYWFEKYVNARKIMIDKACKWLEDIMYFDEYGLTHKKSTMEDFINDFKKAMEG